MNASKQVQTQYFQEDIVQRVSGPSRYYGVVMRCWHDSDDAKLAEPSTDPLLRPLKRGEVGVSFYPNNSREILPESDFKLIDRPMQAGDICKRRYEDVQSAVVTNVDVKFKVSHAVSGLELDEWKTINDVKEFDDIAVGDFVEYNDWIGQVQDFFDESTIQTADGTLVPLPEVSARLTVGERGADIIPTRDGIQSILSYFMGEPSADDIVVSVKHTVYVIAWMAIKQMLTSEEAAARQRPQRLWFGSDISQLTLLRGVNDQLPRVGDRLLLKEAPESVLTIHGRAGLGVGAVKVETFAIYETQTTVELLWQDGSREKVRSTELIPYLNPDEYDCWPGDHVVWKNEDEKQGAVVQGELVFIHKEGCTNGCEKPMVPGIGELEAWVHESPFAQDEDGEFTGWRKELDSVGQRIARRTEPFIDGQINRPVPGDGKINWFGEVTDVILFSSLLIVPKTYTCMSVCQQLYLNGIIEVTLPDLRKAGIPLERITRLNDGLEQLEGLWGDHLSDGHSDDEYEDENGKTYEVQTEDGQWLTYNGGDEDEWIEDDEDVNMDMDGSADVEHDDGLDAESSNDPLNGLVPGAWPIGDENKESSPPLACSTPRLDSEAIDYSINGEDTLKAAPEEAPDSSWTRFELLSSAPRDHAFYSTPPARPSRQFLTRLTKEYRALSSSLPESIVVRTYADRTDLLRSLIIGPENTPYEDAPFGLVLVKEPWFCEPAYEKWRGTDEGKVNSRLYNEKAYVLSRGFVRRAFEIPLGSLQDVIKDVYLIRGKLAKIIKDSRDLIEKSKASKDTDDDDDDNELAVPRLTDGGMIPLTRTLDKLEGILAGHNVV
ncbi:hypothetical protein EW145_g2772 [Phellinidium pouzarii]|uniref:Uncharacterized protein n=1 Tax=Phellinidium pouzarii TaxID=167371 RepID=A0A4S4L9U6_9AGAM|nr:hypothetical protein EW145_g2772 [Phellinidium pouzarii]